ncbi:hypothetical protein LTR17_016301 [Elasticomyces elasticus]|nr:hypothetical protein LTR17_016301 [Elasticomyces elasticus]
MAALHAANDAVSLDAQWAWEQMSNIDGEQDIALEAYPSSSRSTVSVQLDHEDVSLLSEQSQPLVPGVGDHQNEIGAVLVDGDVEIPQFASGSALSPWIPLADPYGLQATKKARWSRRNTALTIQFGIASLVLILNIGLTVFAVVHYGVQAGFSDLYLGSCDKANQINLGLHVLINVFSTALLGSSNFCAQLLASPTRSEVDAAHARQDWLDIGIPSLRNVHPFRQRISLRRRVVWLLLMSSSALLHLTWNSTVFEALPRNTYFLAIVTNDYRDDTNAWTDDNRAQVQKLRRDLYDSKLQKLSKTECITQYADLSNARPDLVVVASNITMGQGRAARENKNSSLLLANNGLADNGYSWMWDNFWMCSAHQKTGDRGSTWCTAKYLLSEADTWTITLTFSHDYNGTSIGRPNETSWMEVDHCLSAGAHSWPDSCTVSVA